MTVAPRLARTDAIDAPTGALVAVLEIAEGRWTTAVTLRDGTWHEVGQFPSERAALEAAALDLQRRLAAA